MATSVLKVKLGKGQCSKLILRNKIRSKLLYLQIVKFTFMRRLIYSLIIALFVCNYTYAQNNVIDQELQEILNQKSEEKISINIIFKSQLDRTDLIERSKHFIDKETRRQAVIKELKNFSTESQYDVLSIIKSAESKSEASNIVCHWLSNSITCTTTKEVIEELSKHDDILLIGYNCDRNVLLGEVSGVSRTGKEITENLVQVNAPKVWEQGYTGEGVLVAILDTGVNYEHPDLADHLWDGGAEYPNHGYNSYDGGKITMDNRGHGTHCAGTICGDGSGEKRTGVAPNVTLMCIKALNDEGSANANSICSGMEFAVEHGADVLSMSLGMANSSVADRTMIRQTCVNVLEAGVIASVAAGNEGSSLNSNPVPNNIRVPGSCPAPWIHPDQQENAGGTSCVVSVGAVDKNDNLVSVSSRGPVTWQNTSYSDYPYNPGIGLIRPDICAPGKDVVSLNFDSDGYVKMTGTSMAAPCVAGVISLMLSKNPELTPAEISEILETTAMKLADKKNNETGSGRVDALAAINAIDMGNIVFKNFTFNDENNNGKINAGEEIKLNVEFENTSNETYNNITAKLTCTNDLVEITNGTTDISNISANQTFNIEDEFIFIINKNVVDQERLYFDVEFYDGNNRISSTRFSIIVTDKAIRFSSFIISNDDNGNGILEAGETADLGVVLNNSGSEIAVNLSGTLKSNTELITINNNNAEFSSIAPNSSAIAYYNVTLSSNAVGNIDIPFELEIKDKYNDVKNIEVNYVSSCNVIYTLRDEFGDGWNGAKIIAHYNDNSESDTYTIANGEIETFTKTINTGVEVSLEWKKGSMDTECTYTIHYENGSEIYRGKGTQKGTFFSWINNCSTQEMRINTGDAVKNFNVYAKDYSVTLKWEKPNTENVVQYEIYRETVLIDTTTNLYYNDENLSSGTYTYSVRPVYEDCYGATVTKEIAFCEGVEENLIPNITIYPNPVNDKLYIATEVEVEEVVVCDIYGRQQVYKTTSQQVVDLTNLNRGIYFVNIKTSVGNVVKKIVKY